MVSIIYPVLFFCRAYLTWTKTNSYNSRNGSVRKSNSLLVCSNTIWNHPLKLYYHWFCVCVYVCVWLKKKCIVCAILYFSSVNFLSIIYLYILEIQYIFFFYLYNMMKCNKLLKQNIVYILYEEYYTLMFLFTDVFF